MINYFKYYNIVLSLLAFLLFDANKVSAQENENIKVEFPEERPQVGFFKELSLDLFGRSDYREHKKMLKQFLKDADDNRLRSYIRSMEDGDPDGKLDALRHYPFVFYVLLGAWYKCYKENDTKTYRYYKIAKEYAKDNTFSNEDAVLVRKIIKFSEKYASDCIPRDIQSEKEFIFNIEQECINYEKKIENDVDIQNTRIGELRTELDTLERKSIKLGNEIANLEDKIKTKEIEIKNLTLENYESALNEFENLSAKGLLNKSGSFVKDLPGGAVLNMQDRVSADPVKQEFYTSGFKLGSFCTDEIKQSTRKIVSSLMQIIDLKTNLIDTPIDFKDSIVVTATVTGKADGSKIIRNKNGDCTLIYHGEAEITGQYYLPNDKSFEFPIAVDIKDGAPICDEELAFLRAICSYDEILAILRAQGISENNVVPKIIVSVFNEKGPEYRGVEINLQVNNLFMHKMQKIRTLRQEKRIIDTRINELKKERNEVDQRKKEIEDPFNLEKKIIAEKIKEINEYQTKN